jgi:uncharacterized protein RhaS with RHS repeats
MDYESGLQLCGYRYYDRETGRWLTRDPIGYEGGMHLYGYVGNSPVNAVAPSGLRDITNTDRAHLKKLSRKAENARFSISMKSVKTAFEIVSQSGCCLCISASRTSGAAGQQRELSGTPKANCRE